MTRKIFIFIALPLVLIFMALVVSGLRGRVGNNTVSNSTIDSGQSSGKTSEKFTAKIVDPNLISHITPLGELNGGYEEAQTIAGITIWNKPAAVEGGKMVEVFAPTEMTLDFYAYYKVPEGDIPEWSLNFRIDKNRSLRLDHITQVVTKISDATTTTPKDNSRTENPKRKLEFKAGEKIAETRGTSQAKNWNIYMTDERVTNIFINLERYQGDKYSGEERLRTATCVFNYYENSQKAEFLRLMGAQQAGQSADCGSVSRDVAGTIAGMWHFEKDPTTGAKEMIDGDYASPLSVYRDSANEIIIDQFGSKRFDLPGAVDPATVRNQHCYLLKTQDSKSAGFAYFELVTETEMKVSYSPSGSCPNSLPATRSKTYYR